MKSSEELRAELKRESDAMRAAMGVDQSAVVKACERIAQLRRELRDNDAMLKHLGRVVDHPEGR